MRIFNNRGARKSVSPSFLAMATVALLLAVGAIPKGLSQTSAPEVEIVEQEAVGMTARFTEYLIDFQRRANAEIATHMNAIEQGNDLGAFFLGLAIAFIYGMIHAFGPGHGKFIIVSYFLGREVRVMRGVIMATQVAIVHVIAAVVIVWLADIVLKAGFGVGLSEVPGVRAGSFLIIVGIGIYMLYQAIRASRGSADGGANGHGQSHGHGHSHGHGGNAEGGILALAAGMVPCPGAVLIMLYAVANDMIYPGFILVAAMSVGIGLSICTLGVGAILARQTAMRVMERSGGSGGVNMFRHTMNYVGATFVTLIGLVSFVAFLDVPLG
jgi:ABC-type nickel/cobalt efflux system permease component RcnA